MTRPPPQRSWSSSVIRPRPSTAIVASLPMYERAYDPAIRPAEQPARARKSLSTALGARGTLANGALWLLSANVFYASCQWLTLVALAKMRPASDLGHFGLALAVVTPVVMVTGFSLRSIQATDVLRRYEFADYLKLRIAANLVGGAIIATAAGLVGTVTAAILLPLGVAKLAEATSETCYGLAQRHDRMRWVALSKSIRGGLGLAALLAVIGLGGTLAVGTWALAATWAGFLFGVDLPAARALEPILTSPKASTLWRLARESAPLGAVNGIFAASQALPRYLLQLSQGAAAVGYFTALFAIIPALDVLAASVGHAAAPRLGWAAGTDSRRYRALVTRLLGLAGLTGGVLVAGAALGGQRFLSIAYSPAYGAYHGAFVLIVLAGGLTVVNNTAFFALVAARKFSMPLAIQCSGFLVTGLTGAWLVPHFGIGGAASSVALGSAAMVTLATSILLRGGPREA